MKSRMSDINKRAWAIRRAAAAKYKCPIMSIIWGECFRQAKGEIMSESKTEKDGYVKFSKKKWSYAGDKSTWASWKDGKLTVKKAMKGTISDSYHNEISEYAALHGIDFDGMSFGQSVTA